MKKTSKIMLCFALLFAACPWHNYANAQIPVTDSMNVATTIKNVMTNIKESKVVVDTINTAKKTSAAIGTAKKTVSEYVVKGQKKITEGVNKVKEYKERAENYKKEYDAYKKQLDDGIKQAKDLKKQAENISDTVESTAKGLKNLPGVTTNLLTTKLAEKGINLPLSESSGGDVYSQEYNIPAEQIVSGNSAIRTYNDAKTSTYQSALPQVSSKRKAFTGGNVASSNYGGTTSSIIPPQAGMSSGASSVSTEATKSSGTGSYTENATPASNSISSKKTSPTVASTQSAESVLSSSAPAPSAASADKKKQETADTPDKTSQSFGNTIAAAGNMPTQQISGGASAPATTSVSGAPASVSSSGEVAQKNKNTIGQSGSFISGGKNKTSSRRSFKKPTHDKRDSSSDIDENQPTFTPPIPSGVLQSQPTSEASQEDIPEDVTDDTVRSTDVFDAQIDLSLYPEGAVFMPLGENIEVIGEEAADSETSESSDEEADTQENDEEKTQDDDTQSVDEVQKQTNESSEEKASIKPKSSLKTSTRRSFKSSSLEGQSRIFSKNSVAFAAIMDLPDGCTDSNGVNLFPKSACMYCALSSSKIKEKGTVDACLTDMIKEMSKAQVYSGRDAPTAYRKGKLEIAALVIAESYRAINKAETFYDNKVAPIAESSENTEQDALSNLVEFNRVIDEQLNDLLQLQASRLALKSYLNYEKYYKPGADEVEDD